MIGLVLSCATAIRTYERLNPRKSKPKRGRGCWFRLAAWHRYSGVLHVSCRYRDVRGHSYPFAALLGSGSLASVFAIRKWRLGLWGQAGIAATCAVALAGFVAIMPAKPDIDFTRRMLSDVKWTGSGAGSFDALLPIYEDRVRTGHP